MCRSSLSDPSALCLRGVRAQTRALKFDGRRRDSARGTWRAAWRGLGLQAQLAAASVGLARRRRRRRLARLRVRIAHWGRGEGGSAMNFQNQQSHGRRRSVFLVQQHNSQRSLLRFVIVARCYGVSTGPRACAHTHLVPFLLSRAVSSGRAPSPAMLRIRSPPAADAPFFPLRLPLSVELCAAGAAHASQSCTHLAVPSSLFSRAPSMLRSVARLRSSPRRSRRL